MQTKTKVFLGVVVVILVVGGIFLVNRPTGLFKGALTVVPQSQTDEDRCEILHKYFRDGVLTTMVRGDFREWNFCENVHPNIAYGWQPTHERCKKLQDWDNQGILTQNLGGNITEAIQCSRMYGDVWYGQPSRPYCATLRRWLDQGILTSSVGNQQHPQLCAALYPNIWNGPVQHYQRPAASSPAPSSAQPSTPPPVPQPTTVTQPSPRTTSTQPPISQPPVTIYPQGFFIPSEQTCKKLKKFDDNNVLSPAIHGTDKLAYLCNVVYPAMWENWGINGPNKARCTQIKEWIDQGVLTANLLLSRQFWHVNDCNFRFPDIMLGARVSRERCNQLREWLSIGTLTQNLGGNMTDALECSRFYRNVWFF